MSLPPDTTHSASPPERPRISRLERQLFARSSLIGLAPLLVVAAIAGALTRLSLVDDITNYFAKSQSQVIADVLGLMIAGGNAGQVADITHAFGQYPVIGEVAITPISPLLASYRWHRPGSVLSSGIEVSISYRGIIYGTLAVQGDTRYVNDFVRTGFFAFLALLVLQWLMTLASARRHLTQSVLRPLGKIHAAIAQLADAKHDHPIEPLHEDNELDEIVADIETARQLVRSILSGLEETVARRTEELTEINDQLIITRDEIVRRERLASLGTLVAGVAHELNTPLGNARLIGSSLADNAERFIRATERGIKRSDLNDYLAVIRDATPALDANLVRAAELINRFKTMSIDQTTGQRRLFRLTEVVEQSLLAMHPQLRKTSLTITTDIPSEIFMDSVPGVFSQMLTNLIENSLTHAFDPGDTGTLHVQASQQKDRVVITYEDDGKGIPDDRVKHVFEPFYTTRRGQGGSGLGLHIIWTLIHSLGGEVQVDGRPGRGARFTINVPRELPPGMGTPATA